MLDFAMEAGLAALFCISGIYAIPYTNISVDAIVHVKRFYYLGIMVLLMILAVAWRPNQVDRRFTACCALLILLYAVNALFRQNMLDVYVYYIFSIVFIWLFVHNVVDKRFSLSRFFCYLRAGVVVVNLLALFVLVRCLFGDNEIRLLVATGFDGNRVNFSIWLWQIVFLTFFLMRGERTSFHFLLPLAASSVLLTIQVFTGGRIGVLATLATIIYFTWRRVDNVWLRLSVLAWLLLLVWMADTYSPIPIQKAEISVFRELSSYRSLGNQNYQSLRNQNYQLIAGVNLMEYADRLLSHRVHILISAVTELDVKTLLIGKGGGNFHVVVDSASWSVHNVFLKLLGEFGISVLLLLLTLVWLPFDTKYSGNSNGYDLHFILLVNIVVGMLQPHHIVTGLSNCLVPWLCYALALKRVDSDHETSGRLRRAL